MTYPTAAASLVAPLLALALQEAAAQPVYRCGNAYSDAPCAQARRVDVDDARTPDQLGQARRVADDERRLARQLQAERLDASSRRAAGAVSLDGPAPSASAAAHAVPRPSKKRRPSAKPARAGDFIALDPDSAARRRTR